MEQECTELEKPKFVGDTFLDGLAIFLQEQSKNPSLHGVGFFLEVKLPHNGQV